MDLAGRSSGTMTPVKVPHSSRSKISEISKLVENSNPNLSSGSPQKLTNSPVVKSAKTKKSSTKYPNQILSPGTKIEERKFVVAKKNLKTAVSIVTCKCKEKVGGNIKKCSCIAYENRDLDESKKCPKSGGEEEQTNPTVENFETAKSLEGKTIEGNRALENESINQDQVENELSNKMGSFKSKRRREKLLEEARSSVSDPGSGRVMDLIKAFERLVSIPGSEDSKGNEVEETEGGKKEMKRELPGLQTKISETEVSSTSVSPSELFFTSENFGMDSRVSSSSDSSQGSFTSRTSGGGRRSRRSSFESSGTLGGRKWKKKQLKMTSLQPFKLRTEQRGRFKEKEFLKKVQDMIMEEEKQRIPIAQGLPLTTDEPECLMKTPVKGSTKPIDLKLHSDLRSVERAEFNHHVAEKLSLYEQYRMERKRQQKLAEEEEIKRLRRELIPRAQPMPYFDKPFIPRRGSKKQAQKRSHSKSSTHALL